MNIELKSTIYRKIGSQVRFAADLGISESLLSRIIRGWRDPSPELRQKIAETLGVEESEIFAGSQPKAEE